MIAMKNISMDDPVYVSLEMRTRSINRSRRKYETDYASDMATARDIGKEEGKAEGIEIGRAEGRMERDREIVRTMKDLEMPFDRICKVTKLTREEAERLL